MFTPSRSSHHVFESCKNPKNREKESVYSSTHLYSPRVRFHSDFSVTDSSTNVSMPSSDLKLLSRLLEVIQLSCVLVCCILYGFVFLTTDK